MVTGVVRLNEVLYLAMGIAIGVAGACYVIAYCLRNKEIVNNNE